MTTVSSCLTPCLYLKALICQLTITPRLTVKRVCVCALVRLYSCLTLTDVFGAQQCVVILSLRTSSPDNSNISTCHCSVLRETARERDRDAQEASAGEQVRGQADRYMDGQAERRRKCPRQKALIALQTLEHELQSDIPPKINLLNIRLCIFIFV